MNCMIGFNLIITNKMIHSVKLNNNHYIQNSLLFKVVCIFLIKLLYNTQNKKYLKINFLIINCKLF